MTLSFRLLIYSIAVAAGVISASAQIPFRLQQNYFTGLSSPVFLTNAGDGTRRVFIVQQRGIIKVAQPGSGTTADYLNISGVVSNSGSERGLLGLAFHPQFENNRRFFVYYTRQSDGAIEIAEYEQNVGSPNTANPTAVRTIITISHPGQSNHNGGTIAFGPDGYLYAAPGDGGSGNDPPNNAQNIESLLGKMLRIDIETPVGQTPAYNIPPTNPYVGVAGRDEIYAIGLRNPYRFSFDRGGTNQLWLGDVGQDAVEEVDIVTSGSNYGWRVYEGTTCTGLDPANCAGGATPIVQTPPVFQYSSAPNVSRCSVTGGYVYRGKQNALPVGSYVFADYCTGEIILWNNDQQTLLLDSPNFLSSFGEDEDGELFVVRLGGSVDKIAGLRTNADFNGDGGSDLSLFRPATGEWFSTSPLNGSGTAMKFGLSTDIPAAEDYDGDGRSDFAIFRPEEGVWYIFRSSDSTVAVYRWGSAGDLPSPGDFTGDRRADLALYRPTEGTWYILYSENTGYNAVAFGLNGDLPVNADFDGDGLDDIAIWRPATGVWWRYNSSDGSVGAHQFGLMGDIPVVGDYDGDGKIDEAVFRPPSGEWYVNRSSDGSILWLRWGTADDVPVVGDYDRDLRDDIAVWRPSSADWWVLKSVDLTPFVSRYGLAGDIPASTSDAP